MNKKAKLALLLAALILTSVVYGISVFCGHNLRLECDFLPSSFITHIVMLVLSVGLILAFRSKFSYRIALPEIKQIWRPILYSMLATIAVNLSLGILSLLIGASLEKHPLLEGMSALQYLVFIVLLASIAEEHLFRGFLQNYLKPLSDKGFQLLHWRISFPVLVSATLFSMAHLILLTAGVSPVFMTRILVFTFVLGLMAGYYQEKHDNIAFAILVHAGGNLVGLSPEPVGSNAISRGTVAELS